MSERIEISLEEASQNAYQVFLFSLQALSSQPEEQCEMMGDYNTAWELRHDGFAGRHLIGSGLFTAEQEAVVLDFMAAIEPVPVNSMPSGAGRAPNLAAMQDKTWEPVRAMAKRLIVLLEPVTQANVAYFQGLADAP